MTFVHLSASLVENITEATHECVWSAVTQLILKVCTGHQVMSGVRSEVVQLFQHINTCHCQNVCCVSQQSQGDSSAGTVNLGELDRTVSGGWLEDPRSPTGPCAHSVLTMEPDLH